MIFAIQKKLSKQFFLFIIAGGTSAIINLLSRIVLSIFLSFEFSILISYLIGMIIAFLLFKKFVFVNTKKSNKNSLAAYTLINLISVIQTFFISTLMRNWLITILDNLTITELVSHLSGLGVLTFTSFLGHKYITFK